MVIESSGIWCVTCFKFIGFDTEKNCLTKDHSLIHFCKCDKELTKQNDI